MCLSKENFDHNDLNGKEKLKSCYNKNSKSKTFPAVKFKNFVINFSASMSYIYEIHVSN